MTFESCTGLIVLAQECECLYLCVSHLVHNSSKVSTSTLDENINQAYGSMRSILPQDVIQKWQYTVPINLYSLRSKFCSQQHILHFTLSRNMLPQYLMANPNFKISNKNYLKYSQRTVLFYYCQISPTISHFVRQRHLGSGPTNFSWYPKFEFQVENSMD